jgi:hypothetical protein
MYKKKKAAMQHAARRDITASCCWTTDQQPSCYCTSLRLRVQLRRLAQLALAKMVLVPLAQPQPVLAHAHPLPQHWPLSHCLQRPHELRPLPHLFLQPFLFRRDQPNPMESLAQLALAKMVLFPLAQPQAVLAHADPLPQHRPLSHRLQRPHELRPLSHLFLQPFLFRRDQPNPLESSPA